MISVKFSVHINGWLGYQMVQKHCRKFQPAEQGAQTLQATDRQMTDGPATAYSKGEREFTFAKNHNTCNCAKCAPTGIPAADYSHTTKTKVGERQEANRHHQLSRSFFQDISHPSSSLYHLLPPPRDTSVLSRLRTATRFTRPISRTKKCCSFINYALNHYQVPPSNNQQG